MEATGVFRKAPWAILEDDFRRDTYRELRHVLLAPAVARRRRHAY
jgi:hypothetical protein